MNQPASNPVPLQHRSPVATALIFVALALMFAFARWGDLRHLFPVVLLLLTAILIVIGYAINGRFLGVLVNERNVMSLARFQLAGWTVVVLAAYIAYVFVRNRYQIGNPLNVGIDARLWALLGISTTSLVGSSLVIGLKKDKEPTPGAVTKVAKLTADRANPPPADAGATGAPVALVDLQASLVAKEVAAVEDNRQGTLYANPSHNDALFTDLFQGDELGNTTRVDLAKVQMFLFTVIVLFAFAMMIASQLRNLPAEPTKLAEALKQLPLLNEGIVALLGISHVGYLANKTVDHTEVK